MRATIAHFESRCQISTRTQPDTDEHSSPPPGDSAGERASGDPGSGSVTELSRIERTSTDRDRGSTQALWEQLERALAEPGPAVGRGWISWNLPSLLVLVASRLHLVWIGTVCGKLKTDFRYSNTLGWNTFPVPMLTAKNRADLTASAEHILLAREAHFPATIADLYASDRMPENLHAAHHRNDEVLERIYIGRRFRNDTERLEKLFELYTKMAEARTIP